MKTKHENQLKRYARYTKYFLQWLFLERMRGLDFSMRDKTLIRKSKGVLHGYSKTDETHANAIFSALHVDTSKRLLDVGCGKGAFLREASKQSFGKVSGLEYVPSLVEIARKNFRRLHLDNKIDLFCGDAAEFEGYANFNVFYFFNPFEAPIMDKVIAKIVATKKEKIWIILHNPVCDDVVKKYGGREKSRLFDKVKSYETVIYEME